MNRWMTVEDAAEFLGIHWGTVYRLARQGQLGRKSPPFRRADVEAYRDRRWVRQAATPPPAETIERCCDFCHKSFDLGQLALITSDDAAGLLCYPCLSRLLAQQAERAPERR